MHKNFTVHVRRGSQTLIGKAFQAALTLTIMSLMTTSAVGQEISYPQKSVRLVVSTPAGGGVDAFARILGENLSRRTGQSVIVENKTGATGALAIQYVLNQPSDGYTLYISPDAAHTFVPVIKKMPYRPIEDFSYISRVAYTPNVIAVSTKFKTTTLKDFLVLAKSNPGKFNYGTMLGIPAQMDFELLKRGTGTDIVSVPYSGGATIAVAMLDGSIDVTLFPITPLSSHIKAGKIQALAVTSSKRLASMPNVPTVAEAGLGNLGLAEGGYFGIVGSANMPAPVISKLRSLISAVMSDPEFREKIAQYDFEPAFMDGDAYKKILVQQLADNEKRVKSMNIKFE
jgi:tripartite-type tricarboxylate transporter receptor subunit TctC